MKICFFLSEILIKVGRGMTQKSFTILSSLFLVMLFFLHTFLACDAKGKPKTLKFT